MKVQSVAVDGPSGAGKSTMAKKLAERLGFLYVDTGAIYRTVALYAQRRGVDCNDAAQVTALLPQIQIVLRHLPDGLQHMFLEGEDVTEEIRRPQISSCASQVSAIPAVRSFLMETQRALAREHNVIMDGRDIGTVVLPQADVKIFLTAAPEERARRRYAELVERGTDTDYDTVLRELKERDEKDTARAAAPLRQAEDAVLVDTTGLSLEESLSLLLREIEGRLRG